MSLHMERIVEALYAGDQLGADREWHYLALLVNEAASVTEMLSLTSEEYTPAPTLSLPPGIPPKPASLLCSDAEYYSLYDTYKNWGWDFDTDYNKYTKQAIAENWTSFWMGSGEDENKRLHFERVGDNWKPRSIPSLE